MDLQLHVETVHITTKAMSSNPAHGGVYSIQLYMIKFVSDLRQVGGFLRVLRFPPPGSISSQNNGYHEIAFQFEDNGIARTFG